MDHLLQVSWARGAEKPGDRSFAFFPLKFAFLILVAVGTESAALSVSFGLWVEAEKEKNC